MFFLRHRKVHIATTNRSRMDIYLCENWDPPKHNPGWWIELRSKQWLFFLGGHYLGNQTSFFFLRGEWNSSFPTHLLSQVETPTKIGCRESPRMNLGLYRLQESLQTWGEATREELSMMRQIYCLMKHTPSPASYLSRKTHIAFHTTVV